MIGALRRFKLTLIVGCFTIVAMLSELGARDVFPAWVGVAVALFPVVLFALTKPGESPLRVVRVAHLIASIWYLVLASALLIAFGSRGASVELAICAIGAAVGAIPCGTVLYQTAVDRYLPSDDSNGDRR